MNKTRLLITALLAVGLLAGTVGSAQATPDWDDHPNPNWGDNPGNSDQPDCSIGHQNPAFDGVVNPRTDDCGNERGNP